jgi:hypothetical protein
MSTKYRLSASVDPVVLAAAQTAVSEGRATNVSAWVNEALYRQAAHDARMRALDTFLQSYEAKHGVITEEEVHAASRRARGRALVVRGKKRTGTARAASPKGRRQGGKAA